MTENGNGTPMYMPVAPAYGYGGNNGGLFGAGGDWWGIILVILLLGGGMWGGFGGLGGYGNMALGYDFPWLLNGQNNINANTNSGFRDAMLNDGITSIHDGITGVQGALTTGFGNVQTALCSGFAGVNSNIANGFAQAEISENARQMANMNQMFGIQSALQNCCCENRAGIADLKYTVATENCADRTQSLMNTRDIIDSQTRGTQAILDKLCALELDGVKGQLAQAQRENVGLQNQLNMAALRESQTAQNAFIAQGFTKEVDDLYTRLSNCPVPSTPVFGRTPIFTCGGNTCGCGANNAFVN